MQVSNYLHIYLTIQIPKYNINLNISTMSTELETIAAKIEIPLNNGTMESNYIDTDVHLTRFYGGIQRKGSLQITFKDEFEDFKHIQLDSKNIKMLKDILLTMSKNSA